MRPQRKARRRRHSSAISRSPQRRDAGCSAARMPRDFGDTTLESPTQIGATMRSLPALGLCALLSLPAVTSAQRVTVLPVNRQFVSVDTAVVALTNVKLIDGTGAPARDAMTVIIEGRTIRAVGPTASTQPPANALVIDLNGHTIIPGLVGLH